MTVEEVKKRYTADYYDKRVVEYMQLIVENLYKDYGVITDSYVVSLDLLAQNYQVYFKGFDDVCRDGYYTEDSKGRPQRNPALSLLTNSQSYIYRILNSMGLTIMSKSKIRPGKDLDSGEGFVNELLK